MTKKKDKQSQGDYMLIFSGYNPDKTVKKPINEYGDVRERPEKFFVHTDILTYPNRQKAFEVFENNTILYEEIGKTDLMKLMMGRYNNNKGVIPLVEVNLIYERDGKRLYYGKKTISYMLKEEKQKIIGK